MKKDILVDACIFIDILDKNQKYHIQSKEKLKDINLAGYQPCISIVTYAELSPGFYSEDELNLFLNEMQVKILPIEKNIAFDSGNMFLRYKKNRKKSTKLDFVITILGDFVIGSTARCLQMSLLTRDRGIFKTYYSDIETI